MSERKKEGLLGWSIEYERSDPMVSEHNVPTKVEKCNKRHNLQIFMEEQKARTCRRSVFCWEQNWTTNQQSHLSGVEVILKIFIFFSDPFVQVLQHSIGSAFRPARCLPLP